MHRPPPRVPPKPDPSSPCDKEPSPKRRLDAERIARLALPSIHNSYKGEIGAPREQKKSLKSDTHRNAQPVTMLPDIMVLPQRPRKKKHNQIASRRKHVAMVTNVYKERPDRYQSGRAIVSRKTRHPHLRAGRHGKDLFRNIEEAMQKGLMRC